MSFRTGNGSRPGCERVNSGRVGHLPATLRPEIRSRARAMFERGSTCVEVALAVGVCSKTASRWRKEWGLDK